MALFRIALGILLLLTVGDQWVKWSARTAQEVIFFTPRVVYENTAVAFGIPLPFSFILVFSFVALCALFIGVVRAFRARALLRAWAISAIIAGGASNTIDRLIWGSVTDIATFPGGLYFNIADVLIVAGIAIWLYSSIHKRYQSTNGYE